YLPLIRSFDRARSEVREDQVRERSSTLRLRPAPTAEYRSIPLVAGLRSPAPAAVSAICVAHRHPVPWGQRQRPATDTRCWGPHGLGAAGAAGAGPPPVSNHR